MVTYSLNGEEISSEQLENACARILFSSGRVVVFQNEHARRANKQTSSSLDITVDGVRLDIRSVTKYNGFSYRNQLTAKHKQLVRYNKDYPEDKSNTCCLYFHDPSMINDRLIADTIKAYQDVVRKNRAENDQEFMLQEIKTLIIVVNTKQPTILTRNI